jgi:hypothetical protein
LGGHTLWLVFWFKLLLIQMEYIERLGKQIQTIELINVKFSQEHKLFAHLFSIEKVNAFTKPSIGRLISIRGLDLVQLELDADVINFSMNYITSLFEISALKEMHLQNFLIPDESKLIHRLEYAMTIINTSIAFDLREIGVRSIPTIAHGEIDIFFGWHQIEQLIHRIIPVALQMAESDSFSATMYIRQLIKENLIDIG